MSAHVTNFKDRIHDLAGIDHADADATEQWFVDGCYDVIRKIKQISPGMIHQFVAQSGDIVNGTAVNLDEIKEIISVDRGGYSCKERNFLYKRELEDVNSIYYAHSTDPSYIIHNGNLSIFPTPAASPNHAQYYYIPDYDVTNFVSGTSSLGDFPSDYYEHACMYAAIKVLNRRLLDISKTLDEDLTSIVLSVPELSIPTYLEPSLPALPSVPDNADVAVDNLGSIKTFTSTAYSMPTMPVLSSFSVPPIPSTVNLVVTTDITIPTAPVYNKPVMTMPDVPTIDPLVISATPPVAPSIKSSRTVDETDITAAIFIPPVMGNLDFADLNTWINTEEDEEMAGARVNAINTAITEYSNRMNESQEKYKQAQELAQRNLDIAKTNMEADASIDDKALSKYGTELTDYNQQVQKDINTYSQNLNRQIQSWTQENTAKMQKYQADISNELNSFNKNNTIYQQEMAVLVKNIDIKESRNAQKMQNYSSLVSSYTNEVNTAIQKWTTEEYTPTITKWQQEFSGGLQKYSTDINQETASVSASVNEFSTQLQKSLQIYQAETGYDLSKYQAEVSAVLQNYQNTLGNSAQTFANELQRYQADVSQINTDNQMLLSRFSADIQNYQAKLGSKSTNYQWLQERLTFLRQEYMTLFGVSQGQEQ